MPALGYRAYGLDMRSQVPLPELAAGSGRSDFSISLGQVEEIEGVPLRYGLVGVRLLDGWLYLKNTAAGRARIAPDAIIIEPKPGCTAEDLQDFVLGNCLGALLHLRGYLVLHASACSVAGSGVAIVGFSGSGKSTAAAALRLAGHPLIADDIVAICWEPEPVLLRGPASLKVGPEAGQALTASGASTRARSAGFKTVHGLDGAQPERVPLKHLLVLDSGPARALSPVAQAASCIELIRHSYCGNVQDPASPGRLLQMCARLSAEVPMSRLLRGAEPLDLDALGATIEGAVMAAVTP